MKTLVLSFLSTDSISGASQTKTGKNHKQRMQFPPMRTILLSLCLIFLVNPGHAQTPSASPNPFMSRTLLSYTISNADTFSLNVYNSTGWPVINVLSNKFLQPGVYQDSLRMDAFPPGMYLAQLLTSTSSPQGLKLYKTAIVGLPSQRTAGVLVFPNPASPNKNLNISVPENCAPLKLKFYDASGMLLRTVIEEQCKPVYEFELDQFAPGLYYIELDGSGRRQKIIIRPR
jgi:hypothetical protein